MVVRYTVAQRLRALGALPAMITVGRALGSKKLATRGVFVIRLSAAVDGATMDLFCVSKTGTITMNRPAVVE